MTRWFYALISIISAVPILCTIVYASNSQEAEKDSFNLSQTIITIVSTVAALFIANIALDWKRHREARPILKINPNETSTYENDVPMPMYKITREKAASLPQLENMIGVRLNYKINRIKIRNNGSTAAEDCKGIIIQDNIEMKICWWVPTERHKMTINAKSYEYLDICAVLMSDRQKIIDNFSLEAVSKLITSYRKTVGTDIGEELDRIEQDIVKRFPKSADASNHLVPYIIAPTENDWQESAFDNRHLRPGKASVRITSKNASPIQYNITILETQEDGKIIKVNDAVNIAES
jgi:hypothetical protein